MSQVAGKPVDKTRSLYAEAVKQCESLERLSDQAKAEQRWAEFELLQDNNEDATLHMKKAIDLFNEWGAKAVSDLLRSRYSYLFDTVSDLSGSVSADDVGNLESL